MPLAGSHVLLICTDYPAADEDGFNDWYTREHVPERVSLPGFLRGRRYEAVGEGPRYCTFYEVRDASALSSDSYLRVLHDPDPRSRHYIPRFVRPARTVARVVASAGRGDGGVLGLVAFAPPGQWAPRVDGVAGLAGQGDIVAAHLWQADAAVLDRSRRGHLRSGDTVYPWVLALEATRAEGLRALLADPLAPVGLGGPSGGATLMAAVYRLTYSLSAAATGTATPG